MKKYFIPCLLVFLFSIQTKAEEMICSEGKVQGSVSKECIQSSGTWENGSQGNGTWTINSDGVLTISGTGKMPGYDLFSSNTPWNTRDVKHMEITDGITSISTLGLDKAGKVTISLADTIKTIEGYAFYHANVDNLILPKNLKSISGVALHCHSAGRVVIPESVENFSTSAWGSAKPMTMYCPPKYYEQCKGDGIRAYLYEKVGDEYVVYNKDGSIKEVYKNYDDFASNKLLSSYVKNADGSYAVYDRNGNFIGFKGKRIYTVEEASIIASPQGNTFKLKYR